MVSIGTPLYSLVQILLANSTERELTSNHYVQEYTEGPNIDGATFIVEFASNFWRHVARRATEHFEALVRHLREHTKAEVD